jgi:hypothetical protein
MSLEIARGPDRWAEPARGSTDDEGRVGQFDSPLAPQQSADYRLCIGTGADFAAMGVVAFDPEVSVVVRIDDAIKY